jgi:hypothetical protein
MRRFVLGNPLLDDDSSVVVLDAEERIVSLSWLLVDHVRRRAENDGRRPAEPSRARACTAREVQIGQPQTFSAIRDPFPPAAARADAMSRT